MINTAFKIPGELAVALREVAAVGKNGSRDLYDWIVNINRLRIEGYTKRRFPDCYTQLDGGDVRMMAAFLEPEWISNTLSLLGYTGALGKEGEVRGLRPRELIAWLEDAFGSLATRDNSFVIADEGSDRGSERWFFVNGIATSRELARINSSALARAFHRGFITVHNPTQGFVHDLVEATLQKFTNINTEPVARAFVELSDALLDDRVDKVVVIAHSQGTIIMGDVLDVIYCALDPKYFDRTNMNDEDLRKFLVTSHGTVPAHELEKRFAAFAGQTDRVARKLELYMFANAASRMCYLDAQNFLPHIESYVNERDIVTRLGALGRDCFHREDLIRIDGPVFANRRYGHLFNAHYLSDFAQGKFQLLTTRGPGECVGSSVHDDVRGNPCDANPLRVPGHTASRLSTYLGQKPLSAAHVRAVRASA